MHFSLSDVSSFLIMIFVPVLDDSSPYNDSDSTLILIKRQ